MSNLEKRASALPSIEKARALLAEARSVGAVKKISAIAQAVATSERGKEIAVEAEAIVLFAQARIGELTREMEKAPHPKGAGRGKWSVPSGNSPKKSAALAAEGLSRKQAAECEKIADVAKSGDLERYTKACQASKTTPTKKGALTMAALPPEERTDFVKAIKSGESPQEAKRAVVAAKIAESAKLPDAKYRVVYADPPWDYGNSMPPGTTVPRDYYPSMKLQAICDLPVREIVEDNAVLFLWTTSPHLEESFQVIKAWGFKYKSSFIWDKVAHNMGHYNSVRHEFLLVCVRGSCQPDVRKLFDSVVTEERTEHSRKPELFREIIDTIYPHGKRVELFRRGGKIGAWETWGNEASDAAAE